MWGSPFCPGGPGLLLWPFWGGLGVPLGPQVVFWGPFRSPCSVLGSLWFSKRCCGGFPGTFGVPWFPRCCSGGFCGAVGVPACRFGVFAFPHVVGSFYGFPVAFWDPQAVVEPL